MNWIMVNKIKYYIHCLHWFLVTFYYEYLLKTNKSRRIQQNYVTNILKYSQSNIFHFSAILKDKVIEYDNSLEILKSLPLLTKEIIRKEKEKVFAPFVNDEWPFWHNTGGSTGEPLKFPLGVIDKINIFKGDLEVVHQLLLYRMMGYSLGDHICSIDGRRVSNEYLDNKLFWGYNSSNIPYGIEHFSTIYLSDETALFYLDKLNEIKPSFLRGYPSGIQSLCRYAKRLNYKFRFKLKGIYLTSENFDEKLCNEIEQIFKCSVWGQYGHSEASIFAYKRPKSEEYYCFPLYGYTEVLDEENNHVSIGEEGNIVVTGFSNYALPFIRYLTGDRAVYGGTLPNGTIILKKLLGRSADYLIDSKKNKWNLVGMIFGGHLRAFNVISQWQLEQKVIGEVTIKIIPDEGFVKSMEKEIIEFFENYDIKAEIIYTEYIPKSLRGKSKFLIQHLDFD